MLVLTRKLNESVRISDDIVVTLLEIRGNRIRLGITAPKDIEITRGELLDEPTDDSGASVIEAG